MTTPSPAAHAANLITREEFDHFRAARQRRTAQHALPFDAEAPSAPLGRLAGFVVRPLDQRRVEHRKRMLRHLLAQQ